MLMEPTALLAQSVDTGTGGLAIAALLALVGFAIFVLWLWALIHAIKNPRLDSTMRIIWVLVILFTSPIGPILYLLLGRGTSA